MLGSWIKNAKLSAFCGNWAWRCLTNRWKRIWLELSAILGFDWNQFEEWMLVDFENFGIRTKYESWVPRVLRVGGGSREKWELLSSHLAVLQWDIRETKSFKQYTYSIQYGIRARSFWTLTPTHAALQGPQRNPCSRGVKGCSYCFRGGSNQSTQTDVVHLHDPGWTNTVWSGDDEAHDGEMSSNFQIEWLIWLQLTHTYGVSHQDSHTKINRNEFAKTILHLDLTTRQVKTWYREFW